MGRPKKKLRGRSSVWLERRPVTPEVASSSLVAPAIFIKACHSVKKMAGLSYIMAYYLYIIQSDRDASFYIGTTHNLDERIMRHNQGRSKYTKSKRPWDLVYFEEHPDRSGAMKREYAIKRRKSKDYLAKLIERFNSG